MKQKKVSTMQMFKDLLLQEDLELKVKRLTEISLALLLEVEALREATIEKTKNGSSSTYGMAYIKTGLLSHNSAGSTDGVVKLMDQWFSEDVELREVLMLKRLGFTEKEINKYLEDSETYEQFT